MATRPFNFNLPDTLRDFMEFSCARNFNTMSKYLIDLINDDMNEFFHQGNSPLGLEEIFDKRPESVDSTLRFVLPRLQQFGFIETITTAHHMNPYEQLHKSLSLSLKVNNTLEKEKLTSIVCHPLLLPLVKPIAEKFGLRVLENSIELMKSHVLLLAGKEMRALSIQHTPAEKQVNKSLGIDEEKAYFNEGLLRDFLEKKLETNSSQPLQPGDGTYTPSSTPLPMRIREVHLDDGTKKFFIQEDLGRHTKPAAMTTNDNGTCSIAYAEDWHDRKEFSTLDEAQRRLKELRGEKPKVLKEVIHV